MFRYVDHWRRSESSFIYTNSLPFQSLKERPSDFTKFLSAISTDRKARPYVTIKQKPYQPREKLRDYVSPSSEGYSASPSPVHPEAAEACHEALWRLPRPDFHRRVIWTFQVTPATG